MIAEYDASFWHQPDYVPEEINGHNGVRIVPPAIDPLSPKNMAFSPRTPPTSASSSGSTPSGR